MFDHNNDSGSTEKEQIITSLGYSSIDEALETLTKMSDMEIWEVDPNSLIDISKIKIDGNLPVEDRIISLLRQTKNPYFYKYNGIVVKISYAGKRTLEECLASCFFDA